MLARIRRGAVCDDRDVQSEEGVVVVVERVERVDGRSMKWKPMAQRIRPAIMIGIEIRRIRRRPMRSIRMRAAIVRTKFVQATEREVSVGEEKPRIVKMVAEKYINEFYCAPLVLTQDREVREDLQNHRAAEDPVIDKQW